jgi:hypothetical protein
MERYVFPLKCGLRRRALSDGEPRFPKPLLWGDQCCRAFSPLRAPLGRFRGGSVLRCLVFAVLGDERLKDGENLLLLMAWKLGDGCENPPGLADRACGGSAGFRLCASQKIVGSDAQGIGERVELIGAEGDGFAFPVSDHALGDTGLGGEFLLGETRGLACSGDTAAERSAFF